MSIHDQMPLPYGIGPEAWAEEAVPAVRAVRAVRRESALAALALAGADGLTSAELAALHGLSGGAASAVLSGLHQRRAIACLEDRRGGRFHIYVLPDQVVGRPTRRRENTGTGKAAKLAERERIREQISELAKMAFPYNDPFGRGWQRACVSMLAILGEE